MKQLNTPFLKKTTLVAISTAMLFGCTTYNGAKKEIENTQNKIQYINAMNETPAPAAVNLSGYYINHTPVAINNDAPWLNKPISLEANNLPLNVLMQRLLRNTTVVASYDASTQAGTPVDINYSGSLKGALQYIAAKTGLNYTIDADHLRWSTFMTKTFNISFMPGSSNYQVGQLSGQNTNNSDSEGAVNDQQFSDLSGSLSIWNDLRKTLNQLKSDKGQVVVAESTTTVTVHDYPANVRAMEKYINQINAVMSKEVSIKVEILEVQLKKQFQFGINWKLAATATLGSNKIPLAFTSQAFQAIGGDTTSTSNASTMSFDGGASTIIHALNTQGKVSVVTQPQVTTMNNQMASIRITKDQGYIKSVSSITTGAAAGNAPAIETTITPGKITDGLTLYILPKIQKNKVFMQISSTLATLESLDKTSNAPLGKTDDAATSANASYTAIQTPVISRKQFNQRSIVRSGETLVVAGYKSIRNETNNSGIIPQLGGSGALSNNIQTVVLITPVILNKAATP